MFEAKRLGVKYGPKATLCLEYVDEESNKLRHRRIHLKDAINEAQSVCNSHDETCDFVAEKVLRHHHEYFFSVPNLKLKHMISLLIKNHKGTAHADENTEQGRVPLFSDNKWQNMDLNKLDDERLSKIKLEMNKDFVNKRKSPGDPDYVYDVRKDFIPSKKSEWDDDDDDYHDNHGSSGGNNNDNNNN